MNRVLTASLGLACLLASSTAEAGCPDGQLQFNFSNLKVRQAFSILADVAKLKPDIDQSVTESEAMKFDCTPWDVVVKDLADRHHLSVKIENGILHVIRK